MLGFRVMLGALLLFLLVAIICVDTDPETKKGEGILK